MVRQLGRLALPLFTGLLNVGKGEIEERVKNPKPVVKSGDGEVSAELSSGQIFTMLGMPSRSWVTETSYFVV